MRTGPGENAGADANANPRLTPATPAAAPAGGRGAGGGGGGGGLTVERLPLIKPPYATISAIDLDKGDILWQIAHGETPDEIKNNAALKGLTIPRTGQSGYNIGTLVTKTLVVAGDSQLTTQPSGARSALLRAYDKKTGKEVGTVPIPAPQSGSPMTYMVNGRQYIVIAVSGGAYSGEYVAYTLPRDEK